MPGRHCNNCFACIVLLNPHKEAIEVIRKLALPYQFYRLKNQILCDMVSLFKEVLIFGLGITSPDTTLSSYKVLPIFSLGAR